MFGNEPTTPCPPPKQFDWDKMRDDKLWGDIRRKAKTDPVLNDLLNSVIEWYMLSK